MPGVEPEHRQSLHELGVAVSEMAQLIDYPKTRPDALYKEIITLFFTTFTSVTNPRPIPPFDDSDADLL